MEFNLNRHLSLISVTNYQLTIKEKGGKPPENRSPAKRQKSFMLPPYYLNFRPYENSANY